MGTERLLRRLFGILLAGIVGLTGLIVFKGDALRAADRLQEARFRSVLLADELRHSSDDLTRMARTFVLTGDTTYEAAFHRILAIRNGEAPRPEGYERIYWDLAIPDRAPPRPDGRPTALRDRVAAMGFAPEELALLAESQAASDSLVHTEQRAFAALRGRFDDGTGRYTRTGPPDSALARRLLFDDAYHAQKARIMRPLDEFLGRVSDRTTREVASSYRRARTILGLALALAVALGVMALAAQVIVIRRIARPLAHAAATAARLAAAAEARYAALGKAPRAPLATPADGLREIDGITDAFARLVGELDDLLGRVQTLHGLLPVCAWCHRIKTEEGNWRQLEAYVAEHSEAEFTHGLCEQCAERLEHGDRRMNG